MDFIKELEDNSILIIDNNIKYKLLDYINEFKVLKSIKIMSFNELKKGLFFDYNNESIYRVMKDFSLDYDTARNYINNLYYLENKIYDNEKYIFLTKIRDYLKSLNLLITDPLFKNLISNKNIYVYGFDYIDSFNKYMLSKLDNVTIINKVYMNTCHEAIAFNNMQDEITYVCESISNLITSGVPLEKIYIANVDDTYYFTMKRICKLFNIPYYIKSETTVYDTAIGEYAVNNFSTNFYSLLAKIKTKFDVENNEFNNKVYLKIKSILDTYFWVKDEDILDLFIAEIKRARLSVNHYEHEITCTNILNNSFNDDEYVFLINFNQGSIPKIKKDIDYLNDDIKPAFLSKSYEYNKDIKEALVKAIGNIKNLVITYKNNTTSGEMLPTSLIDGEKIKTKNGNETISSYSELSNKLLLASKLDKLIKFNEKDDNLVILNSNYDIPYKKYNHKFKSINKDSLIKFINGKINFSYTNIEKFYECPFKFYLKSILRIDEFDDTLDTLIGNAFHHTLEVVLKDNLDPSVVYDEFINTSLMELNNKDKFFIKTLKEEIIFIIGVIRKQYKHFNITRQEFESSKIKNINAPISTNIKGYVDKIIYSENKAFIVDYKTGKEVINSKLFEFGLNLQLPIYLYLLSEREKDTVVQGIYLQHLLSQKKIFSLNKKETKEQSLKLDGITFGPLESIKDMDDSYEKSAVIKGLSVLKTTNDLRYGSKIYTSEQRDELTNLVKTKIDECIDKVSKGSFDIKPVKVEKLADGCKFCPYRDICFKEASDYEIKTIKGDDDECQI